MQSRISIAVSDKNKIIISKIELRDNVCSISWNKTDNIQKYQVRIFDKKSTDGRSLIESMMVDSESVDLDLLKLNKNRFFIEISILDEECPFSSEEIEVFLDTMIEAKKSSFQYLNDNIKQYLTISSMIIAGMVALYSSLINETDGIFTKLFFFAGPFFCGLCAIGTIICQGWIINETSENRFQLSESLRRALLAVAILFFTGFLLSFFFIIADAFLLNGKKNKLPSPIQTVNIEQGELTLEFEGNNLQIKRDVNTGQIIEIKISR